MDLNRRENESVYDYHKRLIYGKLVDKTLADVDYTELSSLLYGKEYSSDVARRMLYGSRQTIDMIEREFDGNIAEQDADEILDKYEQKIFELKKEQQKFFDQRTALNKLIRQRSRQEELNHILSEAVANGDLPSLDYKRHDAFYSDNDLLISLNDIHYGLDIDNYWTKYNSRIFAEMLVEYINKIISVAKLHNSENCYIFMNGDAISGNIHSTVELSNKENVIEQIKGVSELISEFISKLSPYFNNVYFVSVAGNHSRITPSKADARKDERLDDIIEWYLQARLQDFKNVHIGCGDKIDETMYILDIRGKQYCGVHGDYDSLTGSGVQSLVSMVGRPVYAIICGHLHHNNVSTVQGVKTIMSGSFVGVDDYLIQKRILGSPEQIICVCDKDGVRCTYDARFSKH